MDTHYTVVGLVILLGLLFVFLLIWKNRKDRKKFENEASESELPPERHEDEKEKI